jgi:hypothetical protein
LPAALAALVVAALSHCSWEDARELARRAEQARPPQFALPRPIQQPAHDCSHEASCICRGVTLVQASSVAHCKPVANGFSADVIALPRGSARNLLAVKDRCKNVADCFFPPPLSGRQLRALFVSLVI